MSPLETSTGSPVQTELMLVGKTTFCGSVHLSPPAEPWARDVALSSMMSIPTSVGELLSHTIPFHSPTRTGDNGATIEKPLLTDCCICVFWFAVTSEVICVHRKVEPTASTDTILPVAAPGAVPMVYVKV